MKPNKNLSKENITEKTAKRNNSKVKKQIPEKVEDVQSLIQLLEIHQFELENQNHELRIAQEKLEETRNKYINLFDFSPIPYFAIDTKGVIKETNLSASKMFGIERKKLIGRNIITYVTPDDRNIFHTFIIDVFNSPAKQSCQLKMKNNAHLVSQVLLEGIKIEDIPEPDNYCLIALIDLTEYKNIENTLKETNLELTALLETKDKFFSIIAHDLRNAFQALLSYSNIIATEYESLTQEEIIQFHRGLNENLNNLFILLENLLKWSLVQRDSIEYNPTNICLTEIVNNKIGLFKQVTKEKGLVISNRVNAEIYVIADIDMLRSIVQNLLMNAIKFTNENGEIIVSAESEDSFVRVSVSDTGIGIEPDRLSAIFGLKTFSTTQGTAGEKGTGLGLSLCKEFVERNGGKIQVESKLEKGSNFIFTLRKAK